ncbi:MAG: S8 family serine peptidase [Microscillaceae bacterium]|nr:S8 family serine peptidase [Microscillaceae bacterium]MDW8460170.1 S8 family serine peptidase [Cytophagales bacterium]
MKKNYLSTVIVWAYACLLALPSHAQQEWTPASKEPNVKYLETLFEKYDREYKINRDKALRIAAQKGWQIEGVNEFGSRFRLEGIYDDGTPIYYVDDAVKLDRNLDLEPFDIKKVNNLGAAATTRASRLWTGGGLGLHLNGQGMTVFEWDTGRVRHTHQEFDTRTLQGDGASTLDDHATHVAGTLVASGVNSNAKGMAWQANLISYDSSNDLAEMTAAAANASTNGLLVSNHSYNVNPMQTGTFTPWLMGAYEQNARNWDNLAFNSPTYLIVRSGGNNRQWAEVVNYANGYNSCVASAVSKNVLSIGAVSKIPNGYTQPSDVIMSSFSSWGPADDGRIKPDIVAAGVNLFSTSSSGDVNYTTKSGTSMASPNACGSLILVQQHYKNLFNNQVMRSATLKGLAIHTADEAGTGEGPDYRFGWGLLNVERMVQTITDFKNNGAAIIQENVLNQGQTYVQSVFSDGTKPLTVTICWTDPPPTNINANGVDINFLNSPNLRYLVNDLDVRVQRVGSSTIEMPYILDPLNPANNATKGDNDRDNVEKIYIANPTAGEYTIRVTHKGTLTNNLQAYSLIVTGATPAPVIPRVITLSGSLAFGNVPQNTTATRTITVGNTGQANLVISDVKLPNGFTPSWTTATIAPNATRNLEVTFSPTAQMTYSGQLEIVSNATSGTNTMPVSGTGTAPLPAAPTNLIVTAVSDNQISLSWVNNATTATSIELERSAANNTTFFNNKITLSPTTNTYDWGNLQAGTTYAFRVRAVNPSGSSAYSNVVQATTTNTSSGGTGGNNPVALDKDLQQAIDIYPNPSEGIFDLSIKMQKLGKVNVQILNSEGKMIYQTTFEKLTAEEKITLNLSHLPQGIYQAVIDTPNGKVIKRLSRK